MPRRKHCKDYSYGNCGPIEEGEEYCLFHKPDKKEKEKREFYEKLKEQASEEESGYDFPMRIKFVFKDLVNWKGYRFPEIPTDKNTGRKIFSFCCAIFNLEALFDNASFLGDTWFEGVKFREDTSFKGAKFLGEAIFTEAKFRGDVSFKGATFKEDVRFKKARFRGNAEFRHAAFSGETNFVNASVAPIGKADFKDSTFHDSANFYGMKLQIETNKDSKERNEPQIYGKADFSRAFFKRTPNFVATKFGSNLHYRNTNFQQGVDIIPDLGEARQKLDLKGLKNELSERFKLSQAKEEACRIQKISYEGEGKKGEADKVFVEEMRARREQKDGVRKFFDWLVADLTCEYGINWQQILKVSGITIGIFALLYWAFYLIWLGGEGVVRELVGKIGSQSGNLFGQRITSIANFSDSLLFNIFRSLGNSLYYSLVTFTTLGYGDLQPTGIVMKGLSALELLMGGVFMALIVAVFARKWMR